MVASQHHGTPRLDLEKVNFLPVFDRISDGVIAADTTGTIVYYNAAMAKIDDIAVADALNRKVTEIYDLDDDTSMIMRCLNTGLPILDRPFLYRTRMGKVANTIHNAFPIMRNNRQVGAICFVRDYNVLEETISSISIPRKKSSHGKDTRFTFTSIVGHDPEFIRAVNTAILASSTASPVMLYGETGTGKELFAQAIHNKSPRRKQRYTPVNCAAIPDNLLEGILFGTSEGAFTGARNKPGLFELTNGGTVFLDEVNSMSLGLQAKILRVLQERKVRRLGAMQEVAIDLKIVSSVNLEPRQAIKANLLRSDLFYRLGVVLIAIPPLRERSGDLKELVPHFIDKHNRTMGKRISGVSNEVMAFFQKYHWPGNVRELEHLIEGAMNLAALDETIGLRHMRTHLRNLPDHHRHLTADPSGLPDASLIQTAPGPSTATALPHRSVMADIRKSAPFKGLAETQAEHEKSAIENALSLHHGNVSRAAKSLGISRQLLNYKLKKHHIERHAFI